jgi:hypothetical protein
LDTRVARQVLDALDGPLGIGRTRILITHQLELCMPKASYVVHVANGTARVVAQDLTGDRQQPSPEPGNVVHQDISYRGPFAHEQILNRTVHKAKQARPKSSIQESAPKVSSNASLRLYIGALGGLGYVSMYCVALMARQVLVILPTWTLKNIKIVNQEAVLQDSKMDGIGYHVGLFVIGSALAVSGEYLFHAYQTTGTLRASKIFFDTMLDAVVQMPLAWIDSISTGDLTQRFCADSQAMDDRLMPLVSEFLQCAMEMMTIIVVGYVRESSYFEYMLISVKSQSVPIYQLDGPRRSLR